MAVAATIENWEFGDVKPTLEEYARKKGIEYNPARPLDGLDGELDAGGMVRRAFVTLNPEYQHQKNLVKDASASQAAVSRWYKGDFTEDGLGTSIFTALCNAYVGARCEPGFIVENAGTEYETRCYEKKNPLFKPLAKGASYHIGRISMVSREIEFAALSLLLTGTEDAHIMKQTWDVQASRESLSREVLRLASFVLGGEHLNALAKVALDYMRLHWRESEEYLGGMRAAAEDRGAGNGKTFKVAWQEAVERAGIADGIGGHTYYYSDNAGDYDEWAEGFRAAWLEAAGVTDLADIRDATQEAVERRVKDVF